MRALRSVVLCWLRARWRASISVFGSRWSAGRYGRLAQIFSLVLGPSGLPIRLKLRRVNGFRRAEIATLAQRNFHPSSTVVSDGLRCFTGVGNAGCVHQPIITGSGRKAALNPAFKWVNTTLGNIKSAITGTYRAIHDKHAPRYLAEFEYRFSRDFGTAETLHAAQLQADWLTLWCGFDRRHGAGRHKAPDGTDRDRRRLSRRGAQWRQAGPRFAWQDTDRMAARSYRRFSFPDYELSSAIKSW